MPIVAEGCLVNSALLRTTRSSNNSCVPPLNILTMILNFWMKKICENKYLISKFINVMGYHIID